MTTNTRQYPAAQRVGAALNFLQKQEQFIASVGALCQVVPAPIASGITTAATNCIDTIWFNENFMQKFSVSGIRDIIAHEIGHVLFMDGFWDKERRPNHILANIAMDYRINSFLKRAGFPFDDPAFGKTFSIAEAKQWLATGAKPKEKEVLFIDVETCTDDVSAELIYDWLDEAAQKQGKGKGGQPGPGTPGDGSNLPDASTGEAPRPGAPGANGDPNQQGQTPAKPLTEAQRDALKQQIKEAIHAAAQAAKAAGSESAMAERIIGAYGRAPQDWKRVLPRFVRTVTGKLRAPHRSYRRLSKRTGWDAPIVIPLRGRLKGSLGTLVVSIDVSGSIRDEDFNAIAANVKAMCQQAPIGKVHVLYHDVQIVKHEEFASASQVVIRNITAGGTDITSPFRWVEENLPQPPAAMVLFTDLCGPYPDSPPDYPVIWGITYNAARESHGLVPKWGRNVPVPCDG